MQFCKDLYDKYQCDTVVFIGDVVDWHAISFHARHPDSPGPKDEYAQALEATQKWFETFPVAKVCIGNHDERVIRLAETVNIPAQFIRDYNEMWHTPTWDWQYEHVIDNVYYMHGTGHGGMHPAFTAVGKMLMSVVMGHIHTAAGIKWRANPTQRIFGMDVGCGIDEKNPAFKYAQHFKARSILGAGVILDGVPHHEICAIGPGERYNRSRFAASRRRTRK